MGSPLFSRFALGLLSSSVASCAAVDAPAGAIGDCAARAEGDSDPWIDCIEAFDPAMDASYGHDRLPDILHGPPGGTLDSLTLGCGGSVVVFFDPPGVVDGPGPDLIVFENPFSPDFPEAGRVSVSEDGVDWKVFECDPLSLEGCAGITPTAAKPDSGVDPLDAQVAGGEAFDLAEVGLSAARYVRIEDDSATYWEGTGMSYCDPGQGGKGGFDLDAIAAIPLGQRR